MADHLITGTLTSRGVDGMEICERGREALERIIVACDNGSEPENKLAFIRHVAKSALNWRDPSPTRGAVDPDAKCARLLVGRGTDTWDPECLLPAGHGGPCEPEEAELSPTRGAVDLHAEVEEAARLRGAVDPCRAALAKLLDLVEESGIAATASPSSWTAVIVEAEAALGGTA